MKCTGCLLCEITCSVHNTDMVQREASAIQVTLHDLGDSIHEPVVCRQCTKMLCLKSEGKKYDKEEAEKFYWDNKERISQCPFHALFVFNGKVIHCNLCGGDPECVKSCPTRAIAIEKGEEESLAEESHDLHNGKFDKEIEIG